MGTSTMGAASHLSSGPNVFTALPAVVWTLTIKSHLVCQASPTICQQFVAGILSPICQKFPDVCMYHYMDGILIATPKEVTMTEVVSVIIAATTQEGLQIAQKKVQKMPPSQYLVWKISQTQIQPQALTLGARINTVDDTHTRIWEAPLCSCFY